MADQNPGSYTRRLKDEIKKNKIKINDLQEQIKTLQEKLTDHENCQAKINELEEEIRRLREENIKLRTEIGDLKERNTYLENKMETIQQKNGDLENELKKHGEKLKAFELSEDELIIRQLCSKVQENILRLVLQEDFDEIENKSIRYVEKYIPTQIEDKRKQDEARERWEELKDEIDWDDYLIIQLKSIKDKGNQTAHPPLTEENIEKAKTNLKEMKKLGKNNVKAVDKLKGILEKTNSKLMRNRPRINSAEERDRGGRTKEFCKSTKPNGSKMGTIG